MSRHSSLGRIVLDRARFPVEDHVVREPVDDLVPPIVDVGKADPEGAEVLGLGEVEGNELDPARRASDDCLRGLVFRDGDAAVLGVLHVHAGYLALGHVHGSGVRAVFVDLVGAGFLDLVTHQVFAGVVLGLLLLLRRLRVPLLLAVLPFVLVLGLGEGGVVGRDQAEDRKGGSEKTEETRYTNQGCTSEVSFNLYTFCVLLILVVTDPPT